MRLRHTTSSLNFGARQHLGGQRSPLKQNHESAAEAGADLGLLQWWGCSSNARGARAKIWGHAHLIKPHPLLIDRTRIVLSIALVAGTLTSAKPQASPQPVWSVVLQLVQN